MSTMLYHPEGNELIWGIKCSIKIVEDDQVEQELEDGWFKSPLDFDKKSTKKGGKQNANNN